MNKRILIKEWVLPIALLIITALLAACSSKISEANYNKIKTDMTEAEVQEILGPPTESANADLGIVSGTSAKWVKDNLTISIQFFNGKVKIKNFNKGS